MKQMGLRVIRMLRPATSALEKRIGYTFRNKRLLAMALRHPSYRYEKGNVGGDNQRLEFLGDAVMGFVVAAHTYRQHEEMEEGALTSVRSRLTSGKALARIGDRVGLAERLRMGKGEDASGGRNRPSTIADALEAIVGAAYLDGGVRAVERIYHKLFVPELEGEDYDFWAENPKGKLQDVAQRTYHRGPVYRIIREDGPSHERRYTVEVSIGGTTMGVGSGVNKRDAESAAAAEALETIRRSTKGRRS